MLSVNDAVSAACGSGTFLSETIETIIATCKPQSEAVATETIGKRCSSSQ